MFEKTFIYIIVEQNFEKFSHSFSKVHGNKKVKYRTKKQRKKNFFFLRYKMSRKKDTISLKDGNVALLYISYIFFFLLFCFKVVTDRKLLKKISGQDMIAETL